MKAGQKARSAVGTMGKEMKRASMALKGIASGSKAKIEKLEGQIQELEKALKEAKSFSEEPEYVKKAKRMLEEMKGEREMHKKNWIDVKKRHSEVRR